MGVEELRERALNYRQVFVWGDIEDDLTYEVLHELSYLGSISNDPIIMCIHSPGGDLDCACAIIDEMKSLQSEGTKICTIAAGMAHSAAAIMLTMGSKKFRFARPNSSIMLHPCSVSLSEDYEGNQALLMDFLKKKVDNTNRLVAEACGMRRRYKKFLQDIDKGLWLDAKSAVDYGVVDGIWTKPLPIGGSNEYTEEKS